MSENGCCGDHTPPDQSNGSGKRIARLGADPGQKEQQAELTKGDIHVIRQYPQDITRPAQIAQHEGNEKGPAGET